MCGREIGWVTRPRRLAAGVRNSGRGRHSPVAGGLPGWPPAGRAGWRLAAGYGETSTNLSLAAARQGDGWRGDWRQAAGSGRLATGGGAAGSRAATGGGAAAAGSGRLAAGGGRLAAG